jgi:hypothetical protein
MQGRQVVFKMIIQYLLATQSEKIQQPLEEAHGMSAAASLGESAGRC